MKYGHSTAVLVPGPGPRAFLFFTTRCNMQSDGVSGACFCRKPTVPTRANAQGQVAACGWPAVTTSLALIASWGDQAKTRKTRGVGPGPRKPLPPERPLGSRHSVQLRAHTWENGSWKLEAMWLGEKHTVPWEQRRQ